MTGLPVCAPSRDGERVDSGGAMRVSTIPRRTSHRFIPTIRHQVLAVLPEYLHTIPATVRHVQQSIFGADEAVQGRILLRRRRRVDRVRILLRVVRALHDLAVGVNFEHRRRRKAAVGNRRLRCRTDLLIGETRRHVNDPQVIAIIHEEPANVAQDPIVRQRRRPGRVDHVDRQFLRGW